MKYLSALLCAFLVPACMMDEGFEDVGEESLATAGSGTSTTVHSTGRFAGPFSIQREHEDADWDLELTSMGDLNVVVQTITFQPGGHSGWHSHPGPVLITVASGTMTFYDSDDPTCSPMVRAAGQGFLDGGSPHAHIARNETDQPAVNVVVVMGPPGVPGRSDAPDPGHCPF